MTTDLRGALAAIPESHFAAITEPKQAGELMRSIFDYTGHPYTVTALKLTRLHWSGAARCVAGQWPAASRVVCAPAHPCASPLRGLSPARWSACPPPVPLHLGFATSLVVALARNTGATGLTACKPAWPLAYYFTPTSQAATASALSCTLGVQCPRSSWTTMRCLTMRSTVLMRSITRQMGSLPWA